LFRLVYFCVCPFRRYAIIYVINLRKEPQMTAKLLILVVLLLACVPAFAQFDIAWVRTYNGPGDSIDYPTGLAVDGTGNVYVTGYSYGSEESHQWATIKYSPNGDTLWVRRLGGEDAVAKGITLDASGNAYVTGGVSGYLTTIKYSSDGDTAWVRKYNGLGQYYAYGAAIALDEFGNIYVAGACFHFPDNSDDICTIKYHPNGDTAWVRLYDGPGNSRDFAEAVTVDGSGNVYVTGSSVGQGTYPKGADYVTIKYYPNGDTAWVRRYNGPGDSSDYARDIAVDEFGNIFVTGRSCGFGSGFDFATIKYYPEGDTAWVRRYTGWGEAWDEGCGISPVGAGDVYVTGFVQGEQGEYDCTTIRYRSSGDTAWVRTYAGWLNLIAWAYAITVDNSGCAYVVGASVCEIDPYQTGVLLIKYYPNGKIASVAEYCSPDGQSSYGEHIEMDDSGYVYVTGLKEYLGGWKPDYLTIKYHASDHSPSQLPGWRYSITTGSCMAGLYVDLKARHEDPNHWPNPERLWQTECHWPFDALCRGEGTIPFWADQLILHVQDDCAWCCPTEFTILAASRVNGRWKTNNLGVWVQLNIGKLQLPFVTYTLPIGKDQLGLPFVADTLPNVDTLYSVVNLETWVANPQPPQDNYTIVEGTCAELPGFLFGTTPIVFDSMAGPDQNPFSTAPLTGTLYLKGETGVASDFAVLGDADGDGNISLVDVILLANYVLKGGPGPYPLEAGDVNCDGKYTLVDVIKLARYVLFGEPFPC
jgi:hypothetical protein